MLHNSVKLNLKLNLHCIMIKAESKVAPVHKHHTTVEYRLGDVEA